MTRVEEGSKLFIEGYLATVTRTYEVGGEHYVAYRRPFPWGTREHAVLVEDAQEYLVNVNVGDRFQFEGHDVATVVEIVPYDGGVGVRYRYGDDPLTFVTQLEHLEGLLMKPLSVGDTVEGFGGKTLTVERIDGDRVWYVGGRHSSMDYALEYRKEDTVTFVVGDIVRFKPQQFEVLEAGDALLGLSPIDGDDSLMMSPEYFEFVRKPHPKIASVWENGSGQRFVVVKTDPHDDTVWVKRILHEELLGVRLPVFHERYTFLV